MIYFLVGSFNNPPHSTWAMFIHTLVPHIQWTSLSASELMLERNIQHFPISLPVWCWTKVMKMYWETSNAPRRCRKSALSGEHQLELAHKSVIGTCTSVFQFSLTRSLSQNEVLNIDLTVCTLKSNGVQWLSREVESLMSHWEWHTVASKYFKEINVTYDRVKDGHLPQPYTFGHDSKVLYTAEWKLVPGAPGQPKLTVAPLTNPCRCGPHIINTFFLCSAVSSSSNLKSQVCM